MWRVRTFWRVHPQHEPSPSPSQARVTSQARVRLKNLLYFFLFLFFFWLWFLLSWWCANGKQSKIKHYSGLRSRSIDRFEACFSKMWQLIVFINFPERMWPLFAWSLRRGPIFMIRQARKLMWINITVHATGAPSYCVHREPKTSFNRTYFLWGQNVGGHIVPQYFSRIRTLIFSLSARFRGKIISRVLEVFCLAWAIPVLRDGSFDDMLLGKLSER